MKTETDVLNSLEAMIKKHPVIIARKELETLLSWIKKEYPNATVKDLYDPRFLENANRVLYHLATLNDKFAASLLSPGRVLYEVIQEAKTSISPKKEALQTPQDLQTVPLKPGTSKLAAETVQKPPIAAGAHQTSLTTPGEDTPPEIQEKISALLSMDDDPSLQSGRSVEGTAIVKPKKSLVPDPQLKLLIGPTEEHDTTFFKLSPTARDQRERGRGLSLPFLSLPQFPKRQSRSPRAWFPYPRRL